MQCVQTSRYILAQPIRRGFVGAAGQSNVRHSAGQRESWEWRYLLDPRKELNMAIMAGGLISLQGENTTVGILVARGFDSCARLEVRRCSQMLSLPIPIHTLFSLPLTLPLLSSSPAREKH